MHCKSLWIKASAKCIIVNMNHTHCGENLTTTSAEHPELHTPQKANGLSSSTETDAEPGARTEMSKCVGRHKTGWARCIAAGTYFERGGCWSLDKSDASYSFI